MDNNKTTLSLYMITHKDVEFTPPGRTPIFVGDGENKHNYLRDNTGINISLKNKNFCELTAYYWIWKNDKTSEYVSIEHYRRFFMPAKCIIPKIASANQIYKELTSYDVITAQNKRFYTSLKQFYRERHYIEDLLCAEEAISVYYPEYISIFNTVMDRNYAPMYNMIAVSKRNFDNYCQWLFNILFYVEERTDLSLRTEYQQRAYGFLAERLMQVWIEYNNLNVKRLPIYKLASTKLKSFYFTLKGRIPTRYKPSQPKL